MALQLPRILIFLSCVSRVILGYPNGAIDSISSATNNRSAEDGEDDGFEDQAGPLVRTPPFDLLCAARAHLNIRYTSSDPKSDKKCSPGGIFSMFCNQKPRPDGTIVSTEEKNFRCFPGEWCHQETRWNVEGMNGRSVEDVTCNRPSYEQQGYFPIPLRSARTTSYWNSQRFKPPSRARRFYGNTYVSGDTSGYTFDINFRAGYPKTPISELPIIATKKIEYSENLGNGFDFAYDIPPHPVGQMMTFESDIVFKHNKTKEHSLLTTVDFTYST